MESTQNKKMQANRSELGWLGANPDVVAQNPALPTQIAALGQTTDRLATAAATQELHRVAGLDRSVVRTDLRKTLREVHMQPIVNLARVIAPDLPARAADVRMPSTKASAERLLTSAEAMAVAVTPAKDLFVTNGQPADFIDQLRAAATALRTNIDAGKASRVGRAGATASIRSLEKQSDRTNLVIDTLLQRQLRGTPLLTEWLSAKLVTQPATSVSTAAVPTAVPTATATTASAVKPAATVTTPAAVVEAAKVTS